MDTPELAELLAYDVRDDGRPRRIGISEGASVRDATRELNVRLGGEREVADEAQIIGRVVGRIVARFAKEQANAQGKADKGG